MLLDSILQGPVRVTLTWVLIYNVPSLFVIVYFLTCQSVIMPEEELK